MDQVIPPGWSIQQEYLRGTFILTTPAGLGSLSMGGLSAIEVRSEIIIYWKGKGVNVEQHRGTNQAPRSATLTQQAAGNPGGTQAGGGSGWTGPSPHGPNPGAGAGQSAGLMHGMKLAQQQAAIRQQLAKSRIQHLPKSEPIVGELIGHRAWSCLNPASKQPLLSSTGVGVKWEPRVLMKDITYRGQSIYLHNNAGVWSFKDPYHVAIEFWNTAQVFGTIWMWGTVIEHELGYRAQYAAIRSLDCARKGIDLDTLRRIYGVDKPPKCQFCGVAHPD